MITPLGVKEGENVEAASARTSRAAATEERRTARPSGEGSHGSARNTNKTKRVRKVAGRHKNERGQVEAKSERAEVFCRACLLATRPIYGVKGAKRERSLRKKCPL